MKKIGSNRTQRPEGWSWILAPKPFDVVSSSLYLSVLVNDLYFNCGCATSWWHKALIAISIALLLSIERFEYWFYGEEPPRHTAALLLFVRIVLIELIAQMDNFDLSPFLYLVVPFLATLYFGNRAGYLLAFVAWLTYFYKHSIKMPIIFPENRFDNNLIVFTLGLIFAITIARTVVKEKSSRVRAEELLEELEISHQRLQIYSSEIAELATTRERNRLARDIHDTLGHYLTVINIQLEKALAFRERDPQQTAGAIQEAKRMAGEALQDVRESVSALRITDGLFSFPTAVNNLVEHMRSSALSLQLTITGEPTLYSKQKLIVLYRVIQEGLTNIQKHARASSVEISVVFREHEAVLLLTDNGRGFDTIHNPGWQAGDTRKYGLQGVQERLELIGGKLHIESQPGAGCTLKASIFQDHSTHINEGETAMQLLEDR